METFLGLDYPTLWFLVVGAVFSGYVILDGLDFGAGAWHLFLKNDQDRRIALNAIGPVWDGNEVWLVIGGGALFAGFPIFYATLFSGMYTPFILFLVCLIGRAISIEFRSKEPMIWWRKSWDIVYSISSALLAFLLGVVLGNVLLGMPIDANHEYVGEGLFSFLSLFPILTGLTTLTLFMMHGAIFLLIKTEGELFEQITRFLRIGLGLFIAAFIGMNAYILFIDTSMATRVMEQPIFFVVPFLTLLSIANVPRLAYKKKYTYALLFSSLSLAFLMVMVAVELYPNLLFSTLDAKNTLTIYNACSSQKSLGIMLLIAAIGFPLVVGYTVFAYKAFWGKVKLDETSY